MVRLLNAIIQDGRLVEAGREAALPSEREAALVEAGFARKIPAMVADDSILMPSKARNGASPLCLAAQEPQR